MPQQITQTTTPWAPLGTSSNTGTSAKTFRAVSTIQAGTTLLLVGIPAMGKATQVQIGKRAYLDRHYVDVPTITRRSSLIVLLVCIFSVITYTTTGFMILHPFAAAVIGVASIIFYLIGKMTRKEFSKK